MNSILLQTRLTIIIVLFLFVGVTIAAESADYYIAKLDNKTKTVGGKSYYLLVLRYTEILPTNNVVSETYFNASNKSLHLSKDEYLKGYYISVNEAFAHHFLWVPSDIDSLELYSIVLSSTTLKDRDNLRAQAKKQAFTCKLDDLLVISAKSHEEIPEAMQKSYLEYQERAKQREAKETKQK